MFRLESSVYTPSATRDSTSVLLYRWRPHSWITIIRLGLFKRGRRRRKKTLGLSSAQQIKKKAEVDKLYTSALQFRQEHFVKLAIY